jgi:hypothetical protein
MSRIALFELSSSKMAQSLRHALEAKNPRRRGRLTAGCLKRKRAAAIRCM